MVIQILIVTNDFSKNLAWFLSHVVSKFAIGCNMIFHIIDTKMNYF